MNIEPWPGPYRYGLCVGGALGVVTSAFIISAILGDWFGVVVMAILDASIVFCGIHIDAEFRSDADDRP